MVLPQVDWPRLKNTQNGKKSAVFGLIPDLMLSYGENSYKFCLDQVLRHLEAKSINKIFKIQFFIFSLDFSKKAQNPIFWAQILVWMDSL